MERRKIIIQKEESREEVKRIIMYGLKISLTGT